MQWGTLRMGLLFVTILVGLTACGGSSAGQSGVTTVQVKLSEYKIQSSVVRFARGHPYHFVVEDTGQVNHEFMIMRKMKMSDNMSMQDMHKMAFADIDTVAPNQTKTLDYTFPRSASPGTIEFGCHFPGHYQAGMHLDVTLQ